MPWKDLELDGEHMRVRMLRDANRPRSTDEAEEVFFSEAPKSADSGSHILVPNAEKLRIIGELKF